MNALELLRLTKEYADDKDWSRVIGCISLAIKSLETKPAAPGAVTANSKEREIGRHDELRSGVHGDLLLRSRSSAAVAGFAGASLVDALGESEEVMSLNAELGLSMDQLSALARAMHAATTKFGSKQN